MQAVSVGEIEAIGPLIRQLCATSKVEIILTTTTSTGYNLARHRYNNIVKLIGIFPIDLWPCSALAWKQIQPDVVILVESEIWPEHLAQARSANVPAYLINGRLSDLSFARHLKFRRLSNYLLSHFRAIASNSEEDARRYRLLGFESTVTGNIKFDVASDSTMSNDVRSKIRAELGFGDRNSTIVLLGSSTWNGEETFLLQLIKDLRNLHYDIRLLLVPRHSERRKEIAAEINASGLAWHQRSTCGHSPTKEIIVYLADTTGELRILTRVADIVFCGKSLPPHEGGQTPIEAAASGIALVYGPRMSNFRDICKGLEQINASLKASNEETLKEIITYLIENHAERNSMGLRAIEWHRINCGATQRTFEFLKSNYSLTLE